MHRTLLALAFVAASGTLTARAQSPDPTSDSADYAWLRRQINGQALILVRGDWGTAELHRPYLTDRTLSFAEARSSTTTTIVALPSPLPLDTIQRIQVPGSAAGSGALVGAGIGLLGGLAMSIGLTASLCEGGGCSNAGGGSAVITLGSAFGGGLLGALIGSTIKKWKTIYSDNLSGGTGSPP